MKNVVVAGLLGCALIALAVPAAPAAAGELAGVSLPDTVSAGDHQLVLNGMGLRKKFFVKVYVAGLYLGEKTGTAAAVLGADGPRRGTMNFLHAVTKAQLCEGWDEGLEANTPSAPAEVKKDFATLCDWMADVAVGDQVIFTYLPGTGTEIVVKGQSKGTLEGKPFADALFGCWLGPEPGPGEDFKKALLGG